MALLLIGKTLFMYHISLCRNSEGLGILLILCVICRYFSFHFILNTNPINFLVCVCRWALGVLIYFMLRGEMPFGSWRESELDTFAKIAKGQLKFPQTFSPEVMDLIAKVLQ